ncbi:MAG: DUF2911 domain-containing protein [Chitinophagaceae bacterium]
MQIHKPLLPLLALLLAFGCRENKAPVSGTPALRPDTMMAQPSAAANSYPNVDISPMDMSYFPVDYTKLRMADSIVEPPVARVIYSRPHLQRRHLFRDLLRYDEPWRLGANESTEIDLYRPVTIQGQKITPGRYILYCIPHTDSWTIVFNSNIDTWGLRQDTAKDMYRFRVPITTDNPSQEYFTMVFEKTAGGADLVIAWDNIVTKLPLEF